MVADKCDGFDDCPDSSDELNCPKCAEETWFTCECFLPNSTFCSEDDGCISKNKYRDGHMDCPDSSDEPSKFYTKKFHSDIILYRFTTTSECQHIYVEDAHSERCDFLTCYETLAYYCLKRNCSATELICLSCFDFDIDCALLRDSFSIVQCANGNLILSDVFCNGFDDCGDNSDELQHKPGFKCSASSQRCTLPQLNLYDNASQCENGSDLCINHSCFECFDKRLLISSLQVCDDVIDCYDFSDECLCESNIFKPNCDAIFTKQNYDSATACPYDKISPKLNPQLFDDYPSLKHLLLPGGIAPSLISILELNDAESTRECTSKDKTVSATLCDGIPECSDFSDECNCANPPSFCNNFCFSFYPLGDRYCDGKNDPSWKLIDNPACPEGFDENNCPGRFHCKTYENQVSIYAFQKCDGILDCIDGSDEWECSLTFSSETEMIANPVLESAFWIMGIIVTLGNFLVIVITGERLKTKDLTDSLRCQHVIVINIACADLIMGIYLNTIAIFSQIFSGHYGSVDVEWRASLRCSIIGSLAVFSSEASCFLMIILSAFRLHTITNPYSTMTMSVRPWKIAVGAAWLIALVFAAMPIPHRTLDYFTHSVFLPNQFNPEGTWSKHSLSKFACNAAAMRKTAILKDGSDWSSKRAFLEQMFPDDSPLIEFGYYGETSICMPRFYVAVGDNAWEYTLMLITINFLAFWSIAISYFAMFIQFKKQRKGFQQKRLTKQEWNMQKRIARIVATDFACWIPICIMSYARIGGVEFSPLVYQITAVFLLPINSAINPLLFSSVIDKLMTKMVCSSKK